MANKNYPPWSTQICKLYPHLKGRFRKPRFTHSHFQITIHFICQATSKMRTSVENREDGAESKRCYELDWLRVTAVIVLVFFHYSEIFTKGWFHIKNDETSLVFDSLSSFIYIWHMPLFFIVAGASTWFALEFRTGKKYFIICISTIILTYLCCELAKSNRISRFIFGMK